MLVTQLTRDSAMAVARSGTAFSIASMRRIRVLSMQSDAIIPITRGPPHNIEPPSAALTFFLRPEFRFSAFSSDGCMDKLTKAGYLRPNANCHRQPGDSALCAGAVTAVAGTVLPISVPSRRLRILTNGRGGCFHHDHETAPSHQVDLGRFTKQGLLAASLQYIRGPLGTG